MKIVFIIKDRKPKPSTIIVFTHSNNDGYFSSTISIPITIISVYISASLERHSFGGGFTLFVSFVMAAGLFTYALANIYLQIRIFFTIYGLKIWKIFKLEKSSNDFMHCYPLTRIPLRN